MPKKTIFYSGKLIFTPKENCLICMPNSKGSLLRVIKQCRSKRRCDFCSVLSVSDRNCIGWFVLEDSFFKMLLAVWDTWSFCRKESSTSRNWSGIALMGWILGYGGSEHFAGVNRDDRGVWRSFGHVCFTNEGSIKTDFWCNRKRFLGWPTRPC